MNGPGAIQGGGQPDWGPSVEKVGTPWVPSTVAQLRREVHSLLESGLSIKDRAELQDLETVANSTLRDHGQYDSMTILAFNMLEAKVKALQGG